MDTISFHKARPLQSNIDFSEARLQHVVAQYEPMRQMLAQWESDIMVRPEKEALWFYVQQHAMGLAERTLDNDEPMGDYELFITTYHKDVQRKAMRMFYYLLLICTRECRHASDTTDLYNQFPSLSKFHQTHIKDTEAENAIANMLAQAPDVSLGEYTEFLVRSFTDCDYSPGFGGGNWADVARPLRDFAHGKISAEILMDTAFTLEHNNGTIFNKGMLYENCNSGTLHKILDVQRSGQIPQLIANHWTEYSGHMDDQLRDYVRAFSKLESGFTGKVDWTEVKDINGHVKYQSEINKAKESEGGFLNKLKQMKEAALVKAASAKAAAAAAALLKGSIEIMPKVYIPKGKRSQT